MKETVRITMNVPPEVKEQLIQFYQDDERGFSRPKLQEMIIVSGLQVQKKQGGK